MGNREVELTELFRGSKSRNKVSVGEPAEGSLPVGISFAVLCEPYCARLRVVRAGEGVSQAAAEAAGVVAKVGVNLVSPRPFITFFFLTIFVCFGCLSLKSKQLLTVDPSARASMKNAANCDT